MGCPPVREDNPRASASGLSFVQANNPWYNYFIPPPSVYTMHSTGYFVLTLVRMAERKVALVLLSCSKKGNARIDAIILLSKRT